MTIDVIIPSYKPGPKFREMLKRLEKQELPVRKIIVINTEKKYWKEEFEACPILQVHHISKEEFDHGAARNLGASYSQADIFLCMTDDAMPADGKLTKALVKAFENQGPDGEQVIEVYGRQLAEKDCRMAEAYTRQFNYPDKSQLKTIKDLPRLGIKTFFASNVCCAYRRKEFLELGGFINRTIFNEDMIFAAKALKAGYAVQYEAKAKVIHSHNYSCFQQFHRNFDLGVSQADHPEVFQGVPSVGEGIRLVKSTAAFLAGKKKFHLIPGLVINSGFKFLGYQLGKRYEKLPFWLVKRFAMNKNYWKMQEEK